MAASPKPSELIETLIALAEEDLKGNLLNRAYNGDTRTVCSYCMYAGDTCDVCPFSGDELDSLRAVLPILKTMELVDAH